MTVGGPVPRRDQPAARTPQAPRVGLFGLLGSGNIGNDASMESVLSFLTSYHPDAVIDAMCMGSEQTRARYGIDTIPLLWYQKYDRRTSGVTASALKALGKGVDVFRTVSWVRRHDVVIVPGMGVLEATLPLRPWGVPYSMFLLCASGRLFGTKVALVSVGANAINQRVTRWLFNTAARLAFYRSYRDVQSRDAMRERGLDTSKDPVYPDLVFGIPSPPAAPGETGTVGVGVMAYYGTNDDRKRAHEIYAAYVRNVEAFILWLVDSGRTVRLFYGDASDESAVRQILADLRERRPDLEPSSVTSQPVSSFAELTQAMVPVSTVVATRFHNVMCALKLGKPTISIGYAKKNISLMADMGLAEFWQYADSLDVEKLIEQFTKLESDAARLRLIIAERNAANAQLIAEQFTSLSVLLFSRKEHSSSRSG
jgi:polysaccharide pyruvyl transferase WcaK-like protein